MGRGRKTEAFQPRLGALLRTNEGGGDWAGGCANQIKGRGDREGGKRKKIER